MKSIRDIIIGVIKEYEDKKYPGKVSLVPVNAVVQTRIGQADAFIYRLSVIDRKGVVDKNYPVLTDVRSAALYQKGDVVVVQFIYGRDPYIVGRQQ